jgi:transposase
MFGVGAVTGIYLALGSADVRKGANGLYGLVRDPRRCDPLSGHLFLFSNAQRNRLNRLKLIYWDGTGLWVCAKTLQKGRYRWPVASAGQTKVRLTQEELAMLIGGIDFGQAERRRWYRRPVGEEPPSARFTA